MTVERSRLGRYLPWGVLLPVAVAVSVLIAGRIGGGGGGAPTATIEPLAVEAASSYHFEELAELAAASDLVVVGTVEAAERGRLVGDPGGGGVVSRFLTLRVDDVLAPAGGIQATNVLVEEEGWLPDGTPIMVNGLAPTAAGDRGIWFLHQIDSGGQPAYVVINEQGRFLDVAGRAVGAERDDELIAAIDGRPFDEVVAEVRSDGAPR